MLSHTLLALALAPLAVVGRKFTIKNQCPDPATLYINGESQGPLPASGGTTERNFDPSWSGFIYTDVNYGNQTGVGTTRAGFYGDSDIYYMVIDPNYMNVGMSISTDQISRQGWCQPVSCEISPCPYAFDQPPTDFPPPGVHPSLPLVACIHDEMEYTITFCPSGKYPGPGDGPVTLHPNGNPNKCLDVRGAVYANGTPVQIYDCNGTGAQKWVVYKSGTQVRVAGTNFCLDAGSAPANGVKGKIWQCYDNLPAQSWFYTEDNRIALTGQGLCLDLTDGNLANSNQVQTWQCTDGNTNQIWTV